MPYEMHLNGERAINFCLNDKDEKNICLNELNSEWIVLFFFDRNSLKSDNSEIFFYSKAKNEFESLRAQLIGLGPVSEIEIKNFCLKNDVNIILLSDMDYKISKEYGVVYFDKENNKKILPMTFLINKKRIVSKLWNREKMYYRFSGYAGNPIELWEKGKMWAHISLVVDAIKLLDKKMK